MAQRIKTVAAITVEKFFESYKESLKLSLLGERVGFDRLISEPAVNRPGLALAGFFSYFAKKRVQVLGLGREGEGEDLRARARGEG